MWSPVMLKSLEVSLGTQADSKAECQKTESSTVVGCHLQAKQYSYFEV